VKVPVWGIVYVKAPTVEEVDANTEAKDTDGKKRRLARGAARIICDENGKLVFDELNEEHVSLLEKQPWALLEKVLNAANFYSEADPKGNK